MCVEIRNKHTDLIQETSIEPSVLAFSAFMKSGQSMDKGNAHQKERNQLANNRKTTDFESSFRIENISMSRDATSAINDKPSTSPISTFDKENTIRINKFSGNPDDLEEKKLTMMKDNKKVNVVLVSSNNKKNVNNKRFGETENSINKDTKKSPDSLISYNKNNGFYNTHEDFTTNTSMQNKTQEAFTDKKMVMNNNFENNPELYGAKKPVKGFSYNSPDFFKKVDKFMKPNQLHQKVVKTKEFKINTINNQSLSRPSNTQGSSHVKESRSVDQNHISVQGYNKNSMSKNRMIETPIKNSNNTVQNMNFYNNSSYPGAKFLDSIENNKASHINGKKIYFKTDTNFVKNKSQHQKDRMIKVNYGVNEERNKFLQTDNNGETEFRPKTSVIRNFKLDPSETFTPAADKVSKKKRPNSVKIMKINDAQGDYQIHSTYLTGQNKFKGGAFVGNNNPLSFVKGQKQPLSQNHPHNGNIKQDPNRMNKYRDFMKKQKDGKK